MDKVAHIEIPPIGASISNDELSDTFKCGNMGGMRSSKRMKALVLISDHTKALYDDRWDGDIFYYTGMGKTGDQSISYANKTLMNAKYMGYIVYLFEVFKQKKYTYRGEVELAGDYYFENQPDENGNMRKVVIFPLRLKTPNEVDAGLVDEMQKAQQKKAEKLSTDELRKRAAAASTKSSRRMVRSTTYARDEYVAEYTKRRANGRCELCGQPAPFTGKDGKPYLESHHIVWLSKGGADSIENTVALCPNCHRKMHVVGDQSDIKKLMELRRRQ